MSEWKPILCLDFDGVCHMYTSGWKGADVIPDPPVPGLFEFLESTVEVCDVVIYSSRSHQEGGIQAMRDWFALHVPEQYAWVLSALSFPTEKPPALVTLDDHAWCFMGEWPDVDSLVNFLPWNKK